MANLYSEPLFDLLSYARRGPAQRDRVISTDIPQIARTVGRTPEVMVKVFTRGANDLTAVRKHLEYIGRKGNVDLEADSGDKLQSPKDLLDDWDLELDEYGAGSSLTATDRKLAPRLVHKVLFSMPAGTPCGKVLTAVQNLCREEFALQHRYVMALHTDELHPHVHVVIKAVSEHGARLHIRKATLRQWRTDFARHLRAVGVSANATHRYVRGEVGLCKRDGIYRAALRGQSTHMHDRGTIVASEIAAGALRVEQEKAAMMRTRREVYRAWHVVSDILTRQKHANLAEQVRRFVGRMPPIMTDKEYLAAKLVERHRESTASRDASRTPLRATQQKSR